MIINERHTHFLHAGSNAWRLIVYEMCKMPATPPVRVVAFVQNASDNDAGRVDQATVMDFAKWQDVILTPILSRNLPVYIVRPDMTVALLQKNPSNELDATVLGKVDPQKLMEG